MRKIGRVNVNGYRYYRIRRKVGRKINARGEWVPDYKLFYGKTKKEAEQKFREYMENKDKHAARILQELMTIYIKDVLVPDSKLKDSTKDRYISAWNNNLSSQPIATKEISDITGLELQATYNGMTCAASTIKTIHKLLSRAYKYFVAQGIAPRDITVGISLPKVSKRSDSEEVETWEPEELQKILTESEGHRLHFLFVLASNTGLRISELLALRYDDITGDNLLKVQRQVYRDPVFDDAGNTIRHELVVRDLKSTSSVRSVPLSEEVMHELEKHRQWQREEMLQHGYRTEYIFTTQSGKLIDRYNVPTACRRLYKKIGVPYRRFHVFRHTFASRLSAAGVPIQTISKLLGHIDTVGTARYYIFVSNDEKRKAVEKLQIF